MVTQHEVWKDASNIRAIALDKAIELYVGQAVNSQHVLDTARAFAAFLLGSEKAD